MATSLKNLSRYDKASLPSVVNYKFGIIISEWNHEITDSLYQGAYTTLLKNGATESNIISKLVPGSFELPMGAHFLIEYEQVDAVICLGCLIQGETRHFEFICQAVSQGIQQLNLEKNIPVIFGVLTTDTYQQAKDRSGGKHGNKGIEAAVAAIKMVVLKNELKKE